jgi:hypothetical protein
MIEKVLNLCKNLMMKNRSLATYQELRVNIYVVIPTVLHILKTPIAENILHNESLVTV